MRRVPRIEEMRNSFGILVGNSEGKKPSGRHRHVWEHNIILNSQEIPFENMGWTNLTQNGVP
jgi:hypothetical protein